MHAHTPFIHICIHTPVHLGSIRNTYQLSQAEARCISGNVPSERETHSYLTHVREVDLVLTFPQADTVVVHTQNFIRVKLGSLNKFSALDKTKIKSTTHDAMMGLQLGQQQQQLATSSSSSTMGQSLHISSSVVSERMSFMLNFAIQNVEAH